MPATITPIKPRDPLREALREAHAARSRAIDANGTHKEAIERAKEIVASAERKLHRAEDKIEKARAQEGQIVAQAAWANGDVAGGGSILRAARQAESEAADELDAARRALAQLQAADYSVTVQEAHVAVEAATRALLAEQARAAIARLREIDAERAPLFALVSFVTRIGTNEDYSALARAPRLAANESVREGRMQAVLDAPLAEVRAEICKHFQALEQEHYTGKHARNGLWAAARDALRADPDVELPA
jgi:hypothetical protein